MSEKRLQLALDLFRRLPPNQVEQNLAFVLQLADDLTEDLLLMVDQPLKVAKDKKLNKDYLLCDYNRDWDSYRSPWSNEFDPPFEEKDYVPVNVPSTKMRQMEVAANEMFDHYRELYYEGGLSSVYFWETPDGAGFAACVLFKKDTSNNRGIDKGVWDAIHLIEVEELSPTKSKYKLTSEILLSCETKLGNMSLCGSLGRQQESELPVNSVQNHLVNIGNMVQDLENKMRNQLDQVYFGKTKEINSYLRNTISANEQKMKDKLAKELKETMGGGIKIN